MEQIKKPLLSASLYIVLMAFAPLLGEPIIIVLLFMGVPFILVWLAVRILKDGVPSGKSFDDHFYDDRGPRTSR